MKEVYTNTWLEIANRVISGMVLTSEVYCLYERVYRNNDTLNTKYCTV